MKEDLNKITQLIALGDSEEAIELLFALPEPITDLEDDLHLLKNRLTHLKKSAQSGTISWEDGNIERNSINRSLLNLVLALESGNTDLYIEPQQQRFTGPPKAPNSRPPERHPSPGTGIHLNFRWLLVGGLLLIGLVLVWGIVRWRGNSSTSITPDLTIRLIFRPENLPIRQTGLAKIIAGKWVSEALPIPSDGVMHFRNIPAERRNDPVRLELSDVKYACRVSEQSVPVPGPEGELAFYVDLEMQTFRGRVIRPNAQPATGVEIDVDNGLTRTVSDADGNFSITLPKWDAESIRLVLRRNGKGLFDRKVGLDAAVLRELKIPD